METKSVEVKKKGKDSEDRTRDWETWLKGRNREGNALFSLFVKAGSPLSPTSSYGLAIEYRMNDRVPVEMVFGSYSRPKTIGATETSSVQTAGAGTGLLVGDKGSLVYLGAHASVFNIKKGDSSNTFLCLIPSIGIRIESDAEIIFLILMSKNFSISGDISAALGDAPSDIGIFKNGGTQISIGLGIGI